MADDTDNNEAFYEQLRLQQLYGERESGDGQDPYTFKDPSDGTEYEWDLEKKAWFPKITEDFLAMYHANYGVDTENKDESSPSVISSSKQATMSKDSPDAETPKEINKPLAEPAAPKAKGEKRKPDPGWFQIEDQRNTNVYVTGLPPDITNEEFAQIMSKCGIIMRDPVSEEYKVKLYKDREGNLKCDGLCCYLKRESVDLALKLLDEYEVRGYKLHIEIAKFQPKGDYDATKKKKNCKDYKKKLSVPQKQLDWRPEKKASELRKRFERVIIIKNMFHPRDFEVSKEPKKGEVVLRSRGHWCQECFLDFYSNLFMVPKKGGLNQYVVATRFKKECVCSVIAVMCSGENVASLDLLAL
ncbi:17S U2 SnRNP complex component HTATSF1-like [Rhinophrynus dorsalis]